MNMVVLESRIPELVAGSEKKAGLVVQKTGFDIEAGCKVRSRVKLGQMKNAWQTDIIDNHTVVVSNSVEHVLFNEYGTRHMSAQPMLTPSVEAATQPFLMAMGQIYR